jgi:hypothetical protein
MVSQVVGGSQGASYFHRRPRNRLTCGITDPLRFLRAPPSSPSAFPTMTDRTIDPPSSLISSQKITFIACLCSIFSGAIPTSSAAHPFSQDTCPTTAKMPLVKIFAKTAMMKPIPLAALQSKLCDIWGTKPNTTKLMLQRVDDWTDESFAEDVYGELKQ